MNRAGDQHPSQRLVRVYSNLGKSIKFDWNSKDGFWFIVLGKGNRWTWHKNPVTELNTCQLCGKTSTPKNVCIRNDIYGWDFESKKDYETKSIQMLCTGCWNKVRSVVKKINEANQCRSVFYKLTRSIRDERRNRNAS